MVFSPGWPTAFALAYRVPRFRAIPKMAMAAIGGSDKPGSRDFFKNLIS
jgi:hypothetical protein